MDRRRVIIEREGKEMSKETGEIIYYGTLTHGDWVIYTAATDEGLCFVGSPGGGFSELEVWVKAYRNDSKLVDQAVHVGPYVKQIKEYLNKERTEFDIPVDLKGTDFQETVWTELRKITYGETVSYSDIAERIGRPKAVRAVGRANGLNPVMIVVPCHRVVSKNGNLTGFRGGLEMKQTLLEIESVKQSV